MARTFKARPLDHVQSSDSVHVTASAARYFLMLSPDPVAAEADLAELLPPDQKFVLSIEDPRDCLRSPGQAIPVTATTFGSSSRREHLL